MNFRLLEYTEIIEDCHRSQFSASLWLYLYVFLTKGVEEQMD